MVVTVPAPLASAVERIVGVAGTRWSAQSGSSLNSLFRVDAGNDAAFCVKVNAHTDLAMFEAEGAGLAAIADTRAVRVPRVLGAGRTGTHAFLVLEWLELEGASRGPALGNALAALHRFTSTRFGWHRDNTIGTTHQANAWADDWAAFFREQRLAPQLRLARRHGHERFLRDGERVLSLVAALLHGHEPAPSLLHGDLWSGNAASLADGTPVLFDPAVYYGDREADLAMTELFGGFGPDFYAAYRAAWPLPPGYERRRTLYNLYHLLNHLNLFGAIYGPQVQAMLAQLSAA